jgi:hypothetical protein
VFLKGFRAMLMEQLFSRGIMTMGPSRNDPDRQVGVFPSGMIQKVAAIRSGEMERFRWIAGAWNFENAVLPTQMSPAYTDIGTHRFSISEDSGWVCVVPPDGKPSPYLTYDPFGLQWIYVLTRGSFGILRSKEGWVGNQITFTGLMTMIGIDCEWRMTWTNVNDDEFRFLNEEKLPGGSWSYIDEWRYRRIVTSQAGLS